MRSGRVDRRAPFTLVPRSSIGPRPLNHVSIAHRTAQAVGWLTLARVSAKVTDFCLLIVFGRVLTPADFGLVALAMTLIVMLELIADLPVGQVLVRMHEPRPAHYDTAFTLSLIRAAALGALYVALAWPFAWFYRDARLAPIICVLSLAPMVRGLASPRLAHYARVIDFRRDICSDLSGKIGSLLCAGSLALLYPSYWAIAIGTLAYYIFYSATSYILAPYWPRLTLKYVSEFYRFLGWTTAAQFIAALLWQSDKLVLGRFVPSSGVGQFSMGSDLAALPARIMIAPLALALLPAFSIIKNDLGRLRSSYMKIVRTITAIGIPCLVALCFVARPATSIMLGPNWAVAAFGLQVLSISFIPSMFVAGMSPLALALDQTHLLFRRNLYELFIKLPLIALGAFYGGLVGLLFATGLSAAVTGFMSMSFVRLCIGLPITAQLAAPWRTYLSLLPMCAVLIVTREWAAGSGAAQFFGLATSLILAGLAYFGTATALWATTGRIDGFEDLVMTAAKRLTRKSRRAVA